MGKGSAPSAPDPYAAAAAQYQFGTAGANYSTALNDTNTVNPFFSNTYSYNPYGMQNTEGAPTGSPSINPTPTQPQVPPGYASPNGPLNNFTGAPAGNGGWNPIAHQFPGSGGPAAGPPNAGQTPTAPGAPANGQTPGAHVAPNPYSLPAAYQPGGSAWVGGSQNGIKAATPPQYTETTALTAPEQYAAQQAQDQLAHVSGQGQPNMPGMQYQTGPYAGLEYGLNQGAEGQVLQAGMSAITPQLNQQREAMDASLRNSGITPESNPTAYWNAMGPMMQQQGGEIAQIEGQAAQSGIGEQTAANQAAGQSYQEALQNTQLNNQARGQALDQYAQQVGLPLSEMGQLEGLFTGGGGGGAGGASVGTPDIMQAMQNQYQGQLANYNANVGSTNAAMGDATSLLAAYLMS